MIRRLSAAAVALLLALSAPNHVSADNNDVVVLVHGLGGTAESFEYKAELEQSGLRVVSAEVQGYASNHDRAAELFAQLKGMITDYGACHSKEHGHLRFGEDFTGKGLVPDWDENHRIHLIGHSMGGLTIRRLERLLQEGSGCAEDSSQLFTGGHKWITSMTTLASPLDGTTIFNHVLGFDSILINSFLGMGDYPFGSFDFPQWGLVQQPGESFDDYIDRVEDSGIYDEEDFCLTDMKVKGAEKYNEEGPQTFSDTYYFSYATERTNPVEDCTLGFLFCGWIEVPDEKMNEDLKTASKLIGRLADDIDEVNDGIVNQQNARCPGNVGCHEIPDGSTEWTPGKWHVVMLDFLDHYQIMDRDTANDNSNWDQSAKRIYLEHGLRLKKLNSFSRAIIPVEDEFESSEKAAAVERFLASKKLLQNLQPNGKEKSVTGGQIFGAVLGFIALIAFVGFMVVKGRKPVQEFVSSRRSWNRESDEAAISKVTL